MKTPRLGFELPEQCNSPDAMALMPDGNIYLAVPNFGNDRHAGNILRITPAQRLEEVITLPVPPQLKTARPLGVTHGSDGHLYVVNFSATRSTASISIRVRCTPSPGTA